MSYSTAIDALKAALSATPIGADHAGVTLHYAPDPRIASLVDHSQSRLDAAFLLVAESPGVQYPYVQGTQANDYYVRLRLEVATLLHTDVLEEEKTVEARRRAVYEVLCLTNHSEFVIFDDAIPTRTRVADDRRIITTWRFSMRYVE